MQQRNSLATEFAGVPCPPVVDARRTFGPIKIGLTSLFVAAALLNAQRARADIWGYVDATGRAQMASEKLDDRYQLFFKGAKKVGGVPAAGTVLDASSHAAAIPVAGIDAAAAESFRQSALFIRTSTQSNVKRFEPIIEKTAKAHRVDPALVKAVVAVESSFHPDAISPKGARGLMQVIPDTAERYGVVGDRRKSAGQKLLDPATNLQVGIAHLSNLLSMFASNLELALAAYNAGEGAVLKYAKKIPPFPETQEYVKLVKQFYAGFLPPAKNQPAATTMALAASTSVDVPTPAAQQSAPAAASAVASSEAGNSPAATRTLATDPSSAPPIALAPAPASPGSTSGITTGSASTATPSATAPSGAASPAQAVDTPKTTTDSTPAANG